MTEPGVASSDATNMEATAVVDGDEVVDQRPQVVVDRRRPPRLQDLRLHGAHRPRRRPAPPPLDGARAAGHPGREDRADAADDGLLRRAARARRGVLHRRAGAGRQHPVRAGRGLRDRPGPARSRPGPPLHAADRAGRGRRSSSPAGAALERTAFGKPLVYLGGNRERIADARIAIDQARLLVLNAAWKLDVGGSAERALRGLPDQGRGAARWRTQVIDMAIQLHGGAGLSDDFPLAAAYAGARTLRLADGPDEVHRGLVARLELRQVRRPPLMTSPTGRTVLVTGAASGLGAALARPSASAATRCWPPTCAGDVDLRARRHLRRRLGGRASPRSSAAGAGSTCWSTTPASPAAGGSTSPPSTSGAGSPRSTCSASSAGSARSCRCFKRQRSGHIVNVASLAGLVHPAGHGAPTTPSRRPSSRSPRPPATSWRRTASARTVVCPSYFRTNLVDSMQGSDPRRRRRHRPAGGALAVRPPTRSRPPCSRASTAARS